jgi:hypothetical protein
MVRFQIGRGTICGFPLDETYVGSSFRKSNGACSTDAWITGWGIRTGERQRDGCLIRVGSRLPRVPPVTSAFLPERSKSLGVANGGV